MVTGVNAAGDLTLPAQVAYRYRQLFGPEDDVEMEISSTESANGMTQWIVIVIQSSQNVVAKELETLRNESKAMKGLRDAMGTKEYNRKVFKKVFYDDIEHLRAVPELWKTRTAPVSVDLTKLDLVEDTKLIEEDHKIWTIAQCAQIFLEWYILCNTYHSWSDIM